MTSTIEPCLLVGVKASSAKLAARSIALPRAVAAFAMYGHGSLTVERGVTYRHRQAWQWIHTLVSRKR